MSDAAGTAAVEETPTEGFWRVPDDVYFADCEFISNSMIGTFINWRPTYFDKYIAPRQPKDDRSSEDAVASPDESEEDSKSAMNMGTALHAAVFENHRFHQIVSVAPKVDRRTKEGKALWAQFLAESQGKTVITADEFSYVTKMHDNIVANPMAMQLLSMPGIKEVPIRWRDKRSGLWCKGKPDLVSESGILVDLKSCRTCRMPAWARLVRDRGYHRQAAMYIDGLKSIGVEMHSFVHIAVHNAPPFECFVYELTDRPIQMGRNEYQTALLNIRDSLESDDWSEPMSQVVQKVDFPEWMYRE